MSLFYPGQSEKSRALALSAQAKAASILPKLKEQRKSISKGKYFYVKGLSGYEWVGFYHNEKSVRDRVGNCSALLDLLEETLYEYGLFTKQSVETLEVRMIDRAELEKIFPDVIGHAIVSINMPGKFFKEFNLV